MLQGWKAQMSLQRPTKGINLQRFLCTKWAEALQDFNWSTSQYGGGASVVPVWRVCEVMQLQVKRREAAAEEQEEEEEERMTSHSASHSKFKKQLICNENYLFRIIIIILI